jgi:hypothetical protein
MKTNIGTWAAFILASAASLVTYKTAWATSFYWILLSCLADVAVIMGFVVLGQTGLKPWPLVAVIGGLRAGQWSSNCF